MGDTSLTQGLFRVSADNISLKVSLNSVFAVWFALFAGKCMPEISSKLLVRNHLKKK